MKKLLAAVAVLAPALTLLPAAPASASSVCAPITADGQPILCVDTQPVDDALAQVEAEAGLVLSDADAVQQAAQDCRRVEMDPVAVYLPYWAYQQGSEEGCEGYKISVQGSTSGHPVHVPQLCLTTTGTCVGPVDQSVPFPDLSQPLLRVCIERLSWWGERGSGQWTDNETTWDPTDLGCYALPVTG